MSTLRAPLPIRLLYVSKNILLFGPLSREIQSIALKFHSASTGERNYVQISLNLYSKRRNENLFSLYLSYHFFLSLNICIKFCDDLHSVIGDFQTLYLVIMIESFLEKKRGPDLGNKTSRFLKLNRYNTVKIKRNMKLLFYRRW